MGRVWGNEEGISLQGGGMKRGFHLQGGGMKRGFHLQGWEMKWGFHLQGGEMKVFCFMRKDEDFFVSPCKGGGDMSNRLLKIPDLHNNSCVRLYLIMSCIRFPTNFKEGGKKIRYVFFGPFKKRFFNTSEKDRK